MKELRGKVAVVTGAASGIGRALAGRFAAEGMKVVLADVEGPALAKAESELRAGGATVLAIAADVARAEAVDALAASTLEAFGGVHVLCNNAGVYASGLSWERPIADWEWVLGVNLWGVIHGVRTFVPIMLRQGTEAHVVNTASVAGLVSGPFSAPYNVSKYGVVALSESLHYELALVGAQVKVSVLCPGWVNTRIADCERNRPAAFATTARPLSESEQAMEQLGRQMLASGIAPERVAELVLAAVRDERFYVLTHPEFNAVIRTRMEDVVEQRTPTFGEAGAAAAAALAVNVGTKADPKPSSR
jgi:NAD(P)-dependent dehydrogenase (short-subunit alcohol dehydrogenase family)